VRVLERHAIDVEAAKLARLFRAGLQPDPAPAPREPVRGARSAA
jgi:hypothetical protein